MSTNSIADHYARRELERQARMAGTFNPARRPLRLTPAQLKELTAGRVRQ